MMLETWQNTPAYVALVDQMVAYLQGTNFYDDVRFSHLDIERFGSFIDIVRPYTSLEGKTILDSGCGSGGLCAHLLRDRPAHVTGIELDIRSGTLARLRFRDCATVTIINNDASLGLLPPASFDIIFSLHVIEHVVDHRRYVRETAALLKPGGILFLACPHQIWPFEGHTKLPLIHYVPRPLAKKLALLLARSPRIPAHIKRSLEVSTLYEHDFTFGQIKRLVLATGLEILEQNHPRFFLNELVARRQMRLYQRVSQLSLRQQWYLSMLFSQNINVVCRKPLLKA
jgi:2-polyprenyl-3-methyl-5-hydroxy-6-metoxy-1,4-benzoquinol methylase